MLTFSIRRTRALRPVRVLALVALAGFTAIATIAAPAAEAKKKGHKVKVMTRNIYLGADLNPLLDATSLGAVFTAAGVILGEIDRTDFPARAVPLAREIKKHKPQLVGLQEVALLRTQTPSDLGAPPTGLGAPATDVRYDYLKLLRRELWKRGAKYKVAASQDEFEGEFPVDTTGDGVPELDARLTDRDVILARRGTKLKLRNPQGDNFAARFEPGIGAITLPIDRGWVSVDARLKRKRGSGAAKFRFVDTHLEAEDELIREAQAKELIAKGGPLRTKKPVILAGDINSGLAKHKVFGDDQLAFRALKRFGMKDRGATHSCCYSSSLTDRSEKLDHTVDHVLTEGKFRRTRALITGDDPREMTPSGLWPSDHGGVFSTLRIR